MEEGKKKNFISEKIIGRNISKEQAAKYLALAAACGILFGIIAAVTFAAVRYSIDERLFGKQEATREAEGADGEGEIRSIDAAENILGKTGKGTGEASGGTADAAAGSSAQEAGGAQTSGTDQAASGSGLDEKKLEELVRKENENYTYTQQDYQEMMGISSDIVAEIDRHIVAVNAVSSNETWFDDSLETSEAFAGVILSVSDPEILILTTLHAVQGGNTIKVKFQDGTVQEAAAKQTSNTNDLAVIAVPKEGISADTLKKLTPVTLGTPSLTAPGDLVIAAGAPLSKVHSYDFGRVGYIGKNEGTVDGSRDLFYAHLATNLEKGTFLMDLKGQLIGMALLADNSDYSLNINTVRIANVTWLRSFLAQLCTGQSIPYIGILGKDISFDLKYNSNIPQGVYVTDVATDSPAYQAGLRRGDIITGINDQSLADYAAYAAAVHQLKTGETVKITAKRGGAGAAYRDIEVQLVVGAR